MNSLLKYLSTFDDGIAGALVLLFVAAILSLLGRLGLSVLDFLSRRKERKANRRDQERHLREVLVDTIIDADFMYSSIAQITDETRIASLKEVIRQSPQSYRAYVVTVHDDPTFEEYRGIRRQLDIPLMAACDRYFDLSQLFHKYYEDLSSEAFAKLTETRKIAALDELCSIGARTQAAQQTMAVEMQKSDKSNHIYQEVETYLRDNTRIGTDSRKTQQETTPVD